MRLEVMTPGSGKSQSRVVSGEMNEASNRQQSTTDLDNNTLLQR
jgi:hypothetical protein